MTNFASNIDHVAKLDNSLAMSLVLSANNVVLKVGSTYDVSTTVSIYNRTTSSTEYKTVVGIFDTTNIDTYLTSIKTQLELAYPITVSHSTSVGINSVAISNIINIGLIVNTIGYYVRGMVMNISLSGVQQYSIDATLVSPLEITPAMLNITPESLASLNAIATTTVTKASEASASATSALNSLNTFNAAYATIQISLDSKAPLISPSLVTPNIGVATGISFNGITGLSSTTPNMDGTAAIGTSTRAALADHVHPNDTSKSDLITTVVKDSDTGAAFMPSGTTDQRPASPENGYMRYNSDLSAMEAYANGAWGSVGSGTGGEAGGLFYAGDANYSYLNTTTLLSPAATLMQTETSVGTIRSYLVGADVGTNVLFFGGWDGSSYINVATLLSPTAILVQAETTVGTARRCLAAANVGTNALFYGGYAAGIDFSTATLLSPAAVLVQAEGSVGTARQNLAGANVGTNALFYGGDN
jgi:hypothetical protein